MNRERSKASEWPFFIQREREGSIVVWSTGERVEHFVCSPSIIHRVEETRVTSA